MDRGNPFIYVALAICIVMPTDGQRWCRTPIGTRGQCVSVYSCPPLLRLLQRPTLSPQVVSDLRRLQCSKRPNETTFVCCDQLKEDNVRPNQTYSPSNNQGDQIDICGIESATQRILGGTETKLSEHPWMALLEYERSTTKYILESTDLSAKISNFTDNGTWTPECGGFLINNRYVVTAAHCVVGRSVDSVGRLVNIRIGEYDTETNPDCVNDSVEETCNDPVVNMAVEQIIPHEGYVPDNQSNNQNDIALIRLSGNVKFTEFVVPICLPTPDFSGTPVGKNVAISGWGQTLESTRSSVKKKVDVPIVSFDRCQKEYAGRTTLSPSLQICAGGNYIQDSCFRDSGGPLVSRQNGAWIAEGIVSFGIGCGIEISSVYTRVSAFVPWIRSNMRP